MKSSKLRVPEYRHDIVKNLLNYTNEQRTSLLDELRKIEPKTLRLSSESCNNIAVKLGISSPDFEELFDFLLELYIIYYLKELDFTFEDFLEDFRSAIIDIEKEAPEKYDLDNFMELIEEILKMDENIGIIAKARVLRIAHPHVFQSSYIYTDIRPIFTRDLEKVKPTATIFHNLKISYLRKGKRDEISIALDIDDLKKLKKVIDRAIQKETGLQNFLKGKKINYIIELSE